MRHRSVKGNYRITQRFGYDPNYPLNGGFHKGVDYVSYVIKDGMERVDDPAIYAPQDSTVVDIGYDSINGNYLVLEDGAFKDWFSHIKNGGYLVKRGDRVKIGQPIALWGATGAATGAHIHHAVRKNLELVDAEKHITEDEMQTMNKQHVIDAWDMMYGTYPAQADFDYWVGQTFEHWMYNKAKYQFACVHTKNAKSLYRAVLHREAEAGAAEKWVGKPVLEFANTAMASSEWKRHDARIKAPLKYVPLGKEVFIKK